MAAGRAVGMYATGDEGDVVRKGWRVVPSASGETAVYPPTSLLAGVVLFAIGVGFLVISPPWFDVFGAIAGCIFVFGGIALTIESLRRPRPYMTLDVLGAGCARGFVAWGDIERITSFLVPVENSEPQEWFLLCLRRGARLRKGGATSTIAGRSMTRSNTMRKKQGPAFQFWAPPAIVREALQAYYDGPIDFSGSERSTRNRAGTRDGRS